MHHVTYGDLDGLPAPQPGVCYIVSLLTALAAPGRRDLLVPHDQVRNPAGTVIGCRTLAHVTTRQAATHPQHP